MPDELPSRSEKAGRDSEPLPFASNIKFEGILNSLIEGSAYKTNRRPIWEAVGVTSAALSQYTLGHARPRLETMVALADFFGVTLDYLIAGRETRRPMSDESQSITRYVDYALNDLQSKVGRRAWLTARVGQLLVEQIETAVDQASTVPPSGILTVDDIVTLERHANAVFTWNVQLEYDVVVLPSGEAAAGRFAHVVAANLMSSPPTPYNFLVSENPQRPLPDHVRQLKKLLREDFGVPEDRLRLLQFRRTKMPVIIGTCMYELNMQNLRHEDPILALAISDHVSESGEIGFTSLADDSARAETLLAADRVHASLQLLKDLWRAAEDGAV